MTVLDLQADLELSVSDLRARIIGDGSRLTLVSDDVIGLWDEARRAELPLGVMSVSRLLGRLADGLDTAGITLVVTGASGTALTAGRGCDSFVGLVITGDRHVQFGSTRSVSALLAKGLCVVTAQHRGALLGGLLTAVSVVAARAALRRSR